MLLLLPWAQWLDAKRVEPGEHMHVERPSRKYQGQLRQATDATTTQKNPEKLKL